MKKPRLFYFDDTVDAWVVAPDMIENLVSLDCLEEGEVLEVQFKRFDMTDEEFEAIPED